jgi:hypothetical protein
LNTWVNFGSAQPSKVGHFSIGLNTRVQQRIPHMEIFVLAFVLITAMATVDLPEHPEEKAERVPARKTRRAR